MFRAVAEEPSAMPVVTLTTDFGLKDGNVGALKGVIWSICPRAHIADLSHMIAAQNVREAAYLLGRTTQFFPAGTIHVVVVDPGVGTQRRPIAARLDGQVYVCPDNGLLTVQLERAETAEGAVEVVELNRPEFWLPDVSDVFHGRDVFAPTAAHLANGVSLAEVGSLIQDPVRLNLPRPLRNEMGLHGEIIHLDHFGNVVSNIMRKDLEGLETERLTVRIRGTAVHGLVRTFGDHASGELAALFGSSGNLIIAEINGNAAVRLGVEPGDVVDIDTTAALPGMGSA